MARTKEYLAWKNMRGRVNDPSKASTYRDRGIRVCPRWRSFAAFLSDVGPAPSPEMWLERINNRLGYEPGNVRWATIQEQTRNRRTNRVLVMDGVRLCVAEWAERVGIPAQVIYKRISKLGWTTRRALTQPPRVLKGVTS